MAAASSVDTAYQLARQSYADLGTDTDKAIAALKSIPISLHCWQGDDVGGFENSAGLTGGGIQATGNYPGKARTPDELRADLDKAYSLIPGRHRLALHASYGEFAGKKVDRRPGRARAFRQLDRLGQEPQDRPGFQQHVLLASQGRRRLHAVASR